MPEPLSSSLPALWSSKRGRSLLDAALRQGMAFVFDYDGTLAPIYRHPEGARMRASTRRLLRALAQCSPVAVLTGRPVADAARHLDGLPLRVIVGNHGAEWSAGRRSSRTRLSMALRKRVLAWCATEPGVQVEDKDGYGMSIHWRHVSRKRRPAVAQFVGTLGRVRVLPGHRVYNLLPIGAPDKATAIVALHRYLGSPNLLFVGDDVTDERAFALTAGWLTSVRVGAFPETAAKLLVRRQGDVDKLLRRLIEAARASTR